VESEKIAVFSRSLLSTIYYVGRGGEISFCLEKDMWNQQERIWPGVQALRCRTWRKGSITFHWCSTYYSKKLPTKSINRI
jgi:hypothetical protein